MKKANWLLGAVIFLCMACSSSDDGYVPVTVTPAPLQIPEIFQMYLAEPVIPTDNPQTVEGISLGRKLFFDPILSLDQTQSCASCHQPQKAFTDGLPLSIGIAGQEGTRNSMPLHNLAWNYSQKLNWDGSAISLEQQLSGPITNPFELNNTWSQVISSLQNHDQYPELFEQAFGTPAIDSVLVSRAIAQFLRTLISADSPFDRYLLGDENAISAEAKEGFQVFMAEDRGDCFHCHGNSFNPLWTDNTFHNNGLDEFFTDLGLGGVSGDPFDNGKFRAPSLRNLAYTGPYMHDGRFETLDEVINHYSEGLVYSETIDPLMKYIAQGGVQLSEEDKMYLKAFLLSLSDPNFINNPDFQNPF